MPVPAPIPVPYPLVNGFMFSWASVVLQIAGREFRGITSVEYEATRERELQYGNSPDPIGKTLGKNKYKFDVEMYTQEFHRLLAILGDGYGDVVFSGQVAYRQAGQSLHYVTAVGCTLDGKTVSLSEGATGTKVKIATNPVKVTIQGTNDLAVPLRAPAGQ